MESVFSGGWVWMDIEPTAFLLGKCVREPAAEKMVRTVYGRRRQPPGVP
jgi:hypothetical protein